MIGTYCNFVIVFSIQMAKREFRGQRTVDGLSKFCRDQMKSKIHEFHQLQDLKLEVAAKSINYIFACMCLNLNNVFLCFCSKDSKRSIVGYFESKDSKNYQTFERVCICLITFLKFLTMSINLLAHS